MKKINVHNISWLFIAGIIVIFDQLTKKYMMSLLSFGEALDILPFFNFVLLANEGVAFSFFSNHAGKLTNIFTAINLLVSFYILYWLSILPKKQNILVKIALMLILGGAIGNLIDRIQFGFVVDFMHVFYKNFDFPVFNIADSAISVGVAGLILDLMLSRKNED